MNEYKYVLRESKTRTQRLSAQAIEGQIDVLPHPDYKSRQVYKCMGLGKIFDGFYFVKKATHSFTPEGYSVSLDVLNIDHVIDKKPTNTKAKANNKSQKIYTIVPGDTLMKIAKKFNTSWQKIYALNRSTIKDPNIIFPKQKIKLP